MIFSIFKVVSCHKITLNHNLDHLGLILYANKPNFADFGSYDRFWAHCASVTISREIGLGDDF